MGKVPKHFCCIIIIQQMKHWINEKKVNKIKKKSWIKQILRRNHLIMTFNVKWTIIILFSTTVLQIRGTTISNLNVIFETFQPLSMVRFYEFNDVGWNISEKCIKDMFLYLDGLHKDILWAVRCEYIFIFLFLNVIASFGIK